jgi:hypothetical protein
MIRTARLYIAAASIIAALVAFSAGGCSRKESLKERADKLFQKSGGVEQVRAEAARLFSRFGKTESQFLSDSELQKFPAIAALGNMVEYRAADDVGPAQIMIRYGSHRDTQFILIFDGKPDPKWTAGFLEVTNNIFIPDK